ncbi:MAG: aminoacyl--tRNA ligase-related protein, partial [Gaiellaceae bacterium]
ALKPMNCPGHMLLFGSQLRSYRELPFRYAEASTLHRDELAGTLHGILRVRHITQDDAHIFCSPDKIEDEIFGCLDFASYLYDLFGVEARFELSTRPEKKVGTDEEWDFTEAALKSALERRGLEYAINEGDGAFYGPKIDLHMTDVLGRSWQMGTIQLDAQMPQNFGLSYMGADNKLGTDEEWDFTEGELVRALERHEISYFVGEGEGSFYGPKIDLHMTDVLGRSWQLGTIQLDAQMPARFGLTYMGPDNQEHAVFVIHRAFFGSFERFIGILI